MAAPLPAVPASLKSVQHHLKTAQEHDKREPVVAYYCRMYVLQRGMELDKSSPEAKRFLMALMDNLELAKQALSAEEAVHSEAVGQAHVENYALKMFAHADTEDRACRHSKNVVKAFYTAGMLFDVISVFGETSDDIEKYKKYAKYKAAYIHKCLKAGVPPTPGPVGEDGEELELGGLSISGGTADGAMGGYDQPGISGFQQPPTVSHHPQPPASNYQPPAASHQPPAATYQPPAASHQPPAATYQPPAASHQPAPSAYAPVTPSGNDFEVNWDLATKYSKFITSSLTYEDKDAAIKYCQKTLNLLTLGHE